jgi:hypothetical protein
MAMSGTVGEFGRGATGGGFTLEILVVGQACVV